MCSRRQEKRRGSSVFSFFLFISSFRKNDLNGRKFEGRFGFKKKYDLVKSENDLF
jgi:hypothetical protein